MKIIVGDTETTGVRSGDPESKQGVVEIAFVELSEDLDVVASYESLINPEMPITASASGVHGFMDDSVKGAPTLSEFMSKVGNPLNVEDVVFIAHNAKFDLPFFQPFFGSTKAVICTLRLAKKYLPESEDFKLATLRAQWLGKAGLSHRAMADVLTTVELLKFIQQKEDKPVMTLHRESEKPILLPTMTFGKHKDEKFEDIPVSYLKWAVGPKGMTNLDIDLKFTIDYYIAKNGKQ